MIALMGVRISWLILDRNVDLASFAAIARSDLSISASRVFFSVSISSTSHRTRRISPNSDRSEAMNLALRHL